MKVLIKADIQWSLKNTWIRAEGQYYGGAFKY